MEENQTSTDEDAEREKTESVGDDVFETQYYLMSLADQEAKFGSPVDINIGLSKELIIPNLEWLNWDKMPKKMKITNTGYTIIVSAKYHEERPYLTQGPFINGRYVFSQLHFHWGCNNMEGSEHFIDGAALPGEIHVVTFRSSYLTQEAALKEKDGLAVLSFFFKLQNQDNPVVNLITEKLYEVKTANSSVKITPYALTSFLTPFNQDYLIYWGSVTASGCQHYVLWLVCRNALGISVSQMQTFREINDLNGQPLKKNFRPLKPLSERHIFHANPSSNRHNTLYPISSMKKRY